MHGSHKYQQHIDHINIYSKYVTSISQIKITHITWKFTQTPLHVDNMNVLRTNARDMSKWYGSHEYPKVKLVFSKLALKMLSP